MNHPIISIDPSITCTGVAVFSPVFNLLEMNRITAPAISQKNKVQTKIKAHERINRIIEQLDDVLERNTLTTTPMIVIEITSGKTSARHRGGGAGLGTYGMVVGQVVRWAIDRVGEELVMQVYENDWTKGSSKDRRREHARLCYPLYGSEMHERDKGGDVSDALCLGEWAKSQMQIEGAA